MAKRKRNKENNNKVIAREIRRQYKFEHSYLDEFQYSTLKIKLCDVFHNHYEVQHPHTHSTTFGSQNVFHILNSRNPWGTGFKSAMHVNNKTAKELFLNDDSLYISTLKNQIENLMYNTKCQTGFDGFLVVTISIKARQIWFKQHKHHQSIC